jgi:hypothetical protein
MMTNGTSVTEPYYRIKQTVESHQDHLCGPVVRVPGCRLRGPGFNYQIFWVAVCLEWGPLILVGINEELLERKGSSSGIDNWD